MVGNQHSTRFELRLPGTWWRIPLESEADTEKAIKRLIEDSVGRSDELSTLRRQLRGHLSEAADRARAGGGEVMFFAQEIIEGVPLPVSLTVLRPELDLDVMLASQPDRNLPILERVLKRSDQESVRDHWRAFVSRGAAIVRSTASTTGSISDEEGTPDAPALMVDYWVVASGSIRPIVFTFSTSMPQLADSLRELFDAIIESIEWPAVLPAEGGEERLIDVVAADAVS